MKKIFVLLFVIATWQLASAQETKPAQAYTNSVFSGDNVTTKPEFEGGIASFEKFLTDNFKPEDKKPVSGKIKVSFIVEKDGKISSPTVIKSLGGKSNMEIIRVLRSAPNWKPATHKGKAVRYQLITELELGKK